MRKAFSQSLDAPRGTPGFLQRLHFCTLPICGIWRGRRRRRARQATLRRQHRVRPAVGGKGVAVVRKGSVSRASATRATGLGLGGPTDSPGSVPDCDFDARLPPSARGKSGKKTQFMAPSGGRRYSGGKQGARTAVVGRAVSAQGGRAIRCAQRPGQEAGEHNGCGNGAGRAATGICIYRRVGFSGKQLSGGGGRAAGLSKKAVPRW